MLEINSMASLGEGGSFVHAAAIAGYTFRSLINHLLDVTYLRYFGKVKLGEPLWHGEKTRAAGPISKSPVLESLCAAG